MVRVKCMGWPADVENRWRELMAEAIGGMRSWREEHPKATFKEIETTLDERLAKVRAQMLEDAAMYSRMADITALRPEERPKCPNAGCGRPLEAHGQEARSLLTNYDRGIELTRSYAQCPACGRGLFPPR
jgi:hypothetical protein